MKENHGQFWLMVDNLRGTTHAYEGPDFGSGAYGVFPRPKCVNGCGCWIDLEKMAAIPGPDLADHYKIDPYGECPNALAPAAFNEDDPRIRGGAKLGEKQCFQVPQGLEYTIDDGFKVAGATAEPKAEPQEAPKFVIGPTPEMINRLGLGLAKQAAIKYLRDICEHDNTAREVRMEAARILLNSPQ